MNNQDQQAYLSMSIQKDEAQRKQAAQSHPGPCVPWRGRYGEIGSCIYCGKEVDALTIYFSDRANSCHAAKAP